jgi:isochorismate hydrolase
MNELKAAQLGILLIDAQPLFWDYAFPNGCDQKEAILVRMEHLLMLADWMDIPVLATFEEPITHNGELPERLEEVFPLAGQRFAKHTYNCTLESTIRQAIQRLAVKQIAVAGAETDVCVLLSVLGLSGMGYQVYLLEDCLFTSEPHPGPALRRMYLAGVIPCTVKSLAYELVVSTENTPWYPEGWIDRQRNDLKRFPGKFVVPEKWPVWEPVW